MNAGMNPAWTANTRLYRVFSPIFLAFGDLAPTILCGMHGKVGLFGGVRRAGWRSIRWGAEAKPNGRRSWQTPHLDQLGKFIALIIRRTNLKFSHWRMLMLVNPRCLEFRLGVANVLLMHLPELERHGSSRSTVHSQGLYGE